MEPFETIVARVKSDHEARVRAAVEDLVYDIRETSDSPYHGGGWSFDVSLDDAVERISDFIISGGEPSRTKYGDGWNEALEIAATIAEGYPHRFGDEYEASGHIRTGQNCAAKDISQEIRKYKNGE